MPTITSDTPAGEASFLLGWAMFEALGVAYPDRVRFPPSDENWLTAPGHTMFVPVGDGTVAADFVSEMLPTIQREIKRQRETNELNDRWFIEFDYWAHAMSGDSERLDDGLRFDVVVQVRH
ncbi:hypothetical protein JOF42_000379 [Microbacterium phyllosphaerae]|uniref:Uncharacterized protein n=1 Tax=Microbacterium phyllosphaerae TaxID=124798 RepID=A0ABS4WMX8_9MICO|nr:hypothetical protein [Microbacterium phyllosphaerae]MBP2376884.1 hypothetical protein [Microbacterium phyllosphaerae]